MDQWSNPESGAHPRETRRKIQPETEIWTRTKQLFISMSVREETFSSGLLPFFFFFFLNELNYSVSRRCNQQTALGMEEHE